MDVSKNRGSPKWMVKIMENPIKIDDLGVPRVPLFLETPIKNGYNSPIYLEINGYHVNFFTNVPGSSQWFFGGQISGYS